MSGGLEMKIRGVGGELNCMNIAQTVLGDSTAGRAEPGGISVGGGGGSNRSNREDLLLGSSANKKSRRVRRYQHQQHQNKKHAGKRIRRNTQSAPNNTNEYIMQQHDQFHLDLENMKNDEYEYNAYSEDCWEEEGSNAIKPKFYPSSDDDENKFLSREFSAAYDKVNAERLSLMTKAELITEYQQLEERVETLERKLKSVLGGGSQEPSTKQIPNTIGLLTDELKVRMIQDEVARLRHENLKIRTDNRCLRKLIYGDHSEVIVGAEDNEGGSMDSGGGSGSGSDICQ